MRNVRARSMLLLSRLVAAWLLFSAACGGETGSGDSASPSAAGAGGGGNGAATSSTSTSANGGAGSGGSAGAGGAATQANGRYFPGDAVWYEDVSNAATASDSKAITAWMVGFAPPNGWGTGKFRVDFSIVAVQVAPGTAKRSYEPVADSYYVPDCDLAPVPVSHGGAVEEMYGVPTDLSGPFSGYACGGFQDGSDCHMVFFAPAEQRLYEIYRATIDATDTFRGGCLAIWDTAKLYDKNGRGQQCTSADAAGFPIAALLFTPEELAAGVIDHAIRFTLPNNMIRTMKYVSPATHGTKTTGPATSIPYGARLRLRADYPLATLSPAAQVVAKAMQKYGILHADGGNIALTAQSDLLSPVKWADLGFDTHSLNTLAATDFEVIDAGAPIDVTFDCQRSQIIE